MVVLTTLAIVALITALGGGALGAAITAKREGDETVLFRDGKEVFRITETDIIPLAFVEAIPKRITSTLTAKPAAAQVEIKNPLDADSILYNFSVVPNALGKTVGIFEVTINDTTLVKMDAAVLTDSDSFNIPIPDQGVTFRKGEKIKIFVWGDGSSVSFAFSALVGRPAFQPGI